MDWTPLQNVSLDPGREASAEAVYGPGSAWFSGHFPERPVLPGLALAAAALELAVRESAARGRGLEIRGLKKIRFTKIVAPGELLSLSVLPGKSAAQGELPFMIKSGGEKVCHGVLLFRETGSETAGD